MFVFICSDYYESILTGVYLAWEKALTVGHDNVYLIKKPLEQLSLFDEYIYVESNSELCNKVENTIRKKVSNDALTTVYYATLSKENDAPDCIYRFLVEAFRIGKTALHIIKNDAVNRILNVTRNVSNEAHLFREFVRFNSISNSVYVSHIEPKNNVVEIVGRHFADRMISEHWMIVDDNRKIAVVHPKNEENYMRILSDDEFSILAKTRLVNDEYTDLWRTFFDAIAIKERTNYKCQRNLIPIWMRKNTPEFLSN